MFSNWNDPLEDEQGRSDYLKEISEYDEKELLIEICKLLYDIKDNTY